MNLLTRERMIFVTIIIVLVAVLGYAGTWFNSNYVLMPVPKESVDSVNVCIQNSTACELIYGSVDEIPDELE